MVQVKETSPIGTATSRRHCWECQRRRLVCDSVRPVCNRCRNSGIVCPGYGESKPLRWVKPGRVHARNRRRPKSGALVRYQEDPCTDDSATSESSSDDGVLQGTDSALLPSFNSMKSIVLDPIMRYDITCDEPSRVAASYIYGMELYNARSPHTILLENHTQEVVPIASIAPLLPPSMKALLVLLALGHQMYKLPRDVDRDVRARVRSAVAFWAYQAIHAINEDIACEEKQTSDMTMTAVILFLWEDQQYNPSERWRFHFDGLMKMIELRGGVQELYHNSPYMRNGVLTMVALEAFANTTSPSTSQLFHLTHPHNIAFLETLWETNIHSVYVGSICPPALFIAMIKINHLRALVHSHPPSLPRTAQALLASIQSFSPSDYATQHGTKRTFEKWHLIARIHQRAMLLYCLHSLATFFPKSLHLKQLEYDNILLELKEAFQCPHLRNCLFWPLLVAGVCAVNGTAFERAFVSDMLGWSVGDMGGGMPMCAREMLGKFWESGSTEWDECFERPFLFIT